MRAFLAEWPTRAESTGRDAAGAESSSGGSSSGASTSGGSTWGGSTAEESTKLASAAVERNMAGEGGARFIALGHRWRLTTRAAAHAAESDVARGRVDGLRESSGRPISATVVRRTQVRPAFEDSPRNV